MGISRTFARKASQTAAVIAAGLTVFNAGSSVNASPAESKTKHVAVATAQTNYKPFSFDNPEDMAVVRKVYTVWWTRIAQEAPPTDDPRILSEAAANMRTIALYPARDPYIIKAYTDLATDREKAIFAATLDGFSDVIAKNTTFYTRIDNIGLKHPLEDLNGEYGAINAAVGTYVNLKGQTISLQPEAREATKGDVDNILRWCASHNSGMRGYLTYMESKPGVDPYVKSLAHDFLLATNAQSAFPAKPAVQTRLAAANPSPGGN